MEYNEHLRKIHNFGRKAEDEWFSRGKDPRLRTHRDGIELKFPEEDITYVAELQDDGDSVKRYVKDGGRRRDKRQFEDIWYDEDFIMSGIGRYFDHLPHLE